jgi:hypothetical protein
MLNEDLEILKELLCWGGIMTLLYNDTVENIKPNEIYIQQLLKDSYWKCLNYKGSNPILLSGIKSMVDAIPSLHAFYPNLSNDLGSLLPKQSV